VSHCNACFARMLMSASALLFVPIAQAQIASIRPSQHLPMPPPSAPQPAEQARFGEYVATDGQTILVTVSQGPAAYTYVRRVPGRRWAFAAALAPAEGTTGLSGAIRGNVAAVSGTVGERNAVFIFLRTQGQWVQTQTITGFDFSVQFNMIALGTNYLAIGDFGVNDFRGGVHIYNQIGPGTYAFDTTLTTADPTAGPGWVLGFSTIASGDTVTSAAPGGQKLHAFVRADGLWTEQAELDLRSIPQYGFSGDRILLPLGQAAGQPARVQEFVRSGGAWTVGGQLINPQEPDKGLGMPASIDGARAVASESSQVGPVEDAIAFELGSAGWVATTRLLDANLPECFASGGSIPVTLAITGTLVAATCPDASNPHPVFEGRVRVYDLPQ
jgi:hypothetical protein